MSDAEPKEAGQMTAPPRQADTAVAAPSGRWPMGRVLLLLLAAGLVTLMLDIRYEHVEVVYEDPVAWTPIVFSGVMALLSLIGFLIWRVGFNRLLFVLYALGLVVGFIGTWKHTGGAIPKEILHVLSAWVVRYHYEAVPPPLAPAAFIGMGLMGMLACSRTFFTTKAPRH
jgi:hypothetical protein